MNTLNILIDRIEATIHRHMHSIFGIWVPVLIIALFIISIANVLMQALID